MLLACRRLGFDPAGYIDSHHPLQRRIATELAGVLGLGEPVPPCGIDGCSAPTFAVPLAALAHGFARLADPGASSLEKARAEALGRLGSSMAAHPEMVAGPERFTTAITCPLMSPNS